MALVILIVLVLAMLWTAAPSPSGRAMRRLLVERPAELLARLSPGRLVFLLAALIAIVAVIHVFEGDGARLVAAAVPETVSWFVAFDVGTFLDVLVLVWLLGASRSVRKALEQARDRLAAAAGSRRRLRPATRRSPRMRRPRTRARPDADADPAAWGGALAFG